MMENVFILAELSPDSPVQRVVGVFSTLEAAEIHITKIAKARVNFDAGNTVAMDLLIKNDAKPESMFAAEIWYVQIGTKGYEYYIMEWEVE